MRIALSTLSVNPARKTGLPSMFSSFVRESLRLYPDVEFVVFGRGVELAANARLEQRTRFAANDRVVARIATEHLALPLSAARAKCDVLMTNGLVPVTKRLPVAMHLLSLHHLSRTNELGGLRSKYRDWSTRHGLARAGLIITNTRFACQQILDVDRMAAPKLLQSYEGIDHDQFHPRCTPAEQELIERTFGIRGSYFLWCSNFYPYKNAELLMEAWCALPRETRARAPLVMVGGSTWGDSKQRALDIAKKHDAARDVVMLGWVRDEMVPILFRHAAVFVHPSREETFGRSVLEAMASGVPCVVQNIPVMHEVTAGDALMIDYRDVPSATAALERALLDTELRHRLIDGGIARAQEFSFERLAIERVEALRHMLGASPGLHAKRYPPLFANSFV
jgi:glycosyltransferase involved in cell wall biosynthesis